MAKAAPPRVPAAAVTQAVTVPELLEVVRALPDVIFKCVRDPTGRIVWAFNEGRLAEEFHVTTRDVQGKTLDQMFGPEAAANLLPYFERAFNGEPVEWVNELGGRLFKHFPQPVRDANGNVVAVIGFITDVTTLVKAQQDLEASNQHLREANRDLEAFAAAVSHDLRTPLTVILNRAATAQVRLGEAVPDPVRRDLGLVRDAALRMGELMTDLLNFSRAAQKPLAIQRVDVSAMAHESLKALQLAAPTRAVEAHVEEGLQAWGDPGLVRVVLDNLLGNAWKYTSGRADARIEVRGGGTRAGRPAVCIRDNGIGVSPEHAARLFQPFQRLPGSERFQGTGLGLATVRRVAERHGGEAWVEAAAGGGAVFGFTMAPPPAPDGTAAGAQAAA